MWQMTESVCGQHVQPDLILLRQVCSRRDTQGSAPCALQTKWDEWALILCLRVGASSSVCCLTGLCIMCDTIWGSAKWETGGPMQENTSKQGYTHPRTLNTQKHCLPTTTPPAVSLPVSFSLLHPLPTSSSSVSDDALSASLAGWAVICKALALSYSEVLWRCTSHFKPEVLKIHLTPWSGKERRE